MNIIDISIVIPVYNNENDLAACLSSIRKQDYPKEKMEILICDGGSTDKTRDIAKKFGCIIINNEKRLAEFGVTLGMSQAKGKYITILAADNELIGSSFLKNIIYPFSDNKKVMLTYPIQVSTAHDHWISQYINTFTDPVNHFIYGNSANTRSFYRAYQTIQKNDRYSVYDFSTTDYPMIALAQGTTIRKTDDSRKNPGDDILPIVDLIASHRYLAYVPNAQIVHHTISSVSVYFRKQRWAFDNYLMQSDYGMRKRVVYFSPVRKLKKLLWPFYAVSIVLPLSVSLVGFIISGKKEWLYHFPITMVSCAALVFEIVRVTILKRPAKVQRKV
jgi:glycosyltransferase involved in cell wall biosynthesis